jgi:hypothetical protein
VIAPDLSNLPPGGQVIDVREGRAGSADPDDPASQ